MKANELKHLLMILNKIANPNADVDLAKTYVQKDIALRNKQRRAYRDNLSPDFHLGE